jgi:hypothetical protein
MRPRPAPEKWHGGDAKENGHESESDKAGVRRKQVCNRLERDDAIFVLRLDDL